MPTAIVQPIWGFVACQDVQTTFSPPVHDEDLGSSTRKRKRERGSEKWEDGEVRRAASQRPLNAGGRHEGEAIGGSKESGKVEVRICQCEVVNPVPESCTSVDVENDKPPTTCLRVSGGSGIDLLRSSTTARSCVMTNSIPLPAGVVRVPGTPALHRHAKDMRTGDLITPDQTARGFRTLAARVHARARRRLCYAQPYG